MHVSVARFLGIEPQGSRPRRGAAAAGPAPAPVDDFASFVGAMRAFAADGLGHMRGSG